MTLEQIANLIEDVPDFPKPGITFKDITPVLADNEAFTALAKHFAGVIHSSVNKILCPESRGFILGAAIAQHRNVSLVLVRKPGKLPRETISYSYDLEYGSDTLEIHKDELVEGDCVAIIDDVLATGGTAQAVEKMCEQTHAKVMGHHFFMEIEGLKGRDHLKAPVQSFLQV